MTHSFDPDIIAAILHHMNDDHTDDNLLIVRAFAGSEGEIADAVMTGFDGDGGDWTYALDGAASAVRVPWPGGPISERPAVRREVVALYDLACERLGIEPRPHA